MRSKSGSLNVVSVFALLAGILGGFSAHSATCDNGQTFKLKTYILGSMEASYSEDDRRQFIATHSLEGWDYSEENGLEMQRFFGKIKGESVAQMTGSKFFDFGKLVRVQFGSEKSLSHYDVKGGVETEVYHKTVVLKIFTSKNCGFEVIVTDVIEGSEDAQRLKEIYSGLAGLDISMSMDVDRREPSTSLFPEDLEAEKNRPAILVRNALIKMKCASPSKHAFCKVR